MAKPTCEELEVVEKDTPMGLPGALVVIAFILAATTFTLFPEIPRPEKFLKIELVKKETGAETIYFIRKRAGSN